MDLWLPNGSSNISTTVTNFPEEIADENLVISSCSSPLTSSPNMIYGDEYISQILFYPFTLSTCQPLSSLITLPTDFATMQLESFPGALLDFSPNHHYGDLTITTNENTINIVLLNSTLSGGSRNVVMEVSVNDNINSDDYIENAYLYFDEPSGSNLFSSVTVSTNTGPAVSMTRTGDRWYCYVGNFIVLNNYQFTINAEVGNCIAQQSVSIPIYFSSSCDPVSASLPTTFCYTCSTNCSVGFPQVGPPNFYPPSIDYTLCQNITATYTFHSTTYDVHDLHFDMRMLDPTLQNVSATFWYKETPTSTACSLATIPINTANIGYTLAAAASSCFNGIVKAGGDVYIDLNFTPVNVFSGSPFSLNYNFVSYCGSNSPVAASALFTRYSNIGANCSPSVSVLPNTTVCAGSSVTFTASIVNGTPGTITYDWFNNGTPVGSTPGTSTLTTTVGPADVITVSVSINGQTPIVGTSNVIVSSFSNCCYPSDFNNFSDIDLSGLQASQLPFTTYNTSARIVINDRLTIDQDLTFSYCPNILMGPGAVIEILAGATLTIGTSHIRSVPDCNQMWSGIQVNTGANLVLFEGIIEDAATAVNMQVNSSLHSSKSMRFLNNVIGVNANLPYNANGINSIGFEVDDTYFESTRNLITEYPGQSLKPRTVGFAGIRLSRVSSLVIGGGITEKIHFKNLNFGIFSNVSNLIVENCKFKDILNYDPGYPRGRFSGTGIYCESKATLNELTQTGDNDNLDADFDNCLTGILTMQTGLRISENQMRNVDIGIRSLHANYAKIYIERNNIDCNSVGVSLIDNDKVLIMDVLGNTIHAGNRSSTILGNTSHTLGIDVADNNTNLTSAVKRINDNIIYLHEYGRIGLHLTTGRDYEISGNYVSMKNASRLTGGLVNMRGVQIENSEYNTISCNNIVGESDLTIYQDNDAAMQIADCNENLISQNSMFWSSNGLRFIGDCVSNGGNATQNIQKNTFGPNFYGLHYTVNSSVEQQDFSGNQWRIPPVSGQFNAINEISDPVAFLLSKYNVTGANYTLPIGVTPSWFVFGTGPDLTINPADCGLPPTGSPNEDIAKLLDMIGDTLNTSDFYKKLVWQYQIQLFAYLQKYPDLVSQSPDLYDFYSATAATNISQIVEIINSKRDLLSEQTVLLNEIKQRSLEIYNKSMLLKEVERNLTLDISKDEIKDSLIAEKNNLQTALEYLIMVNNTSVEALNASIAEKVVLLTGQNMTLDQVAIYEKLEKDVNTIYFKLLSGVPEDSLPEEDAMQIVEISELCPLIAGPAVYHARSIRKLTEPNTDYDDALICLQSGYIYRSGKMNENSFSLYPNPSSGNFTLTYSLATDGILGVIDLLGRHCYTRKLNSGENTTEFNLTDLIPGIYYYHIKNADGKLVFNGKLVIE